MLEYEKHYKQYSVMHRKDMNRSCGYYLQCNYPKSKKAYKPLRVQAREDQMKLLKFLKIQLHDNPGQVKERINIKSISKVFKWIAKASKVASQLRFTKP